MQVESECVVWVVDDEREVLEYLETALSCEGCRVYKSSDIGEITETLREGNSDVHAFVFDLELSSREDFLTVQELRSMNERLPIFALSAASTQAQLICAKKAGVTEVFSKPLRIQDLQRIASAARVSPANFRRAEASEGRPSTPSFLGSSPAMREAKAILRMASGSNLPVLIRGETGSGKEVVAKELHRLSARANRPFVKLNCAALPSELVESELFGYERGAFTGAFQRKLGLFELADTGTVLLDEIGDMDVRLQAKLLQVLQDKEFKRLGGKDTVRVDIRVLAATHRDLENGIANNTFREDLFYRLSVVSIDLPPLRERGDDIIRLTELLLKKHAAPGAEVPSIPASLREALLEHSWPGNVRELENLAQRFLLFKDAEMIVRDLRNKARTVPNRAPATIMAPVAPAMNMPIPSPSAGSVAPASAPGEPMAVSRLEEVSRAKDQAESRAILDALDAARWNRKRAARMLNIDYKALLYRMKKLSLEQTPVSAGVN